MQEDIQPPLALIHSQGDKVELHEVVAVAKDIQIQRNLDYKKIRHHAYT